MDNEENEKFDKDESARVRERIGEIMSQILSRKYDANVKIRFRTKEEIEAEKKNKK